jgi:hypothetical protein
MEIKKPAHSRFRYWIPNNLSPYSAYLLIIVRQPLVHSKM